MFRALNAAIFASCIVLFAVAGIAAQDSAETTVSMLSKGPVAAQFRIGEKLTYDLTFGKMLNAGYAETFVISRGSLSGRDAVEIRAKLRTSELVSAAFLTLDEARTVYASPDTSLPLQVVRNVNSGIFAKQVIANFLKEPTTNFDLLTLIYKARETGGVGTFGLLENDAVYNVTFAMIGAEKLKTAAGDFDTNVSLVQSEFLASVGIKELKINFSTDDAHIPVAYRVKTLKGEYRASLVSISMPPVAPPPAKPTPTPSPTPAPTPKTEPTAEKYVENRPLNPELGFQIGEVLEYRISSAGKPLATITFNVRERKRLETKRGAEENLMLVATISGVEPGTTAFRLGDMANAGVDPDTLAPRSSVTKFASVLAGLNQTIAFDRLTGSVNFGGDVPVDAPIGTHSILSLIYAMRSFNLKPSKDPNNPVNDTRVAVFWESKPYIFTLRPSDPEDILLNGEKVSAQLITVKTDNTALDAAQLRVWLGAEDRVPLKMSFGVYQAELVVRSSNLSQ